MTRLRRWIFNNWCFLWALASGRIIAELPENNVALPSVAFSPDGKVFAIGSRDREILLWSTDTRREVLRLPGQGAKVAFSPSGGLLACATSTRADASK